MMIPQNPLQRRVANELRYLAVSASSLWNVNHAAPADETKLARWNARAEGSPLKIEIRHYDNAIAFLIQAWPDFWYGNKVLGIEPSSEKHLDDIVESFREHNLSFRFEIMPVHQPREE